MGCMCVYVTNFTSYTGLFMTIFWIENTITVKHLNHFEAKTLMIK